MDNPHLKELFKQAAELARLVPESMQGAAFNKALEILLSELPVPSDKPGGRKTKKRGRSTTLEVANRPGRKTSTGRIKKQKGRSSSSRPGRKAIIEELLSEGFFKSGKISSDIQKYLKNKRGYPYKTNELTPALIRLVREGALERDTNQDGQYVYKSH